MFQFVNRALYSNIFVIGCGGTGSRLAPMLIQFLRTISRPFNPVGHLESPKIYFVDDDVVEQKNLLRQNFIEQDVGRPKASVLAERYGRAFGMEISAVVSKVTAAQAWSTDPATGALRAPANYLPQEGASRLTLAGSLVVLCVDSAKARKEILQNLMDAEVNFGTQSRPAMVIDAGNEDNFGQVRFWNAALLVGQHSSREVPPPGSYLEGWLRTAIPRTNPHTQTTHLIPLPLAYYRELGESVSEKSCADLDQTLAINAIMATTIMGIVQNLYYFKPMTYDGIRISLDGGNATEYNLPMRWYDRIVPYGSKISVNAIDAATLYSAYGLELRDTLSKMRMKLDANRNLIPIAPPPAPIPHPLPKPVSLSELAAEEGEDRDGLEAVQDEEADAAQRSRLAAAQTPRRTGRRVPLRAADVRAGAEVEEASPVAVPVMPPAPAPAPRTPPELIRVR
jgi:hypothetical protein